MKISSSDKSKVRSQDSSLNLDSQNQSIQQTAGFDFYNLIKDASAITTPPPAATVDAPTQSSIETVSDVSTTSSASNVTSTSTSTEQSQVSDTTGQQYKPVEATEFGTNQNSTINANINQMQNVAVDASQMDSKLISNNASDVQKTSTQSLDMKQLSDAKLQTLFQDKDSISSVDTKQLDALLNSVKQNTVVDDLQKEVQQQTANNIDVKNIDQKQITDQENFVALDAINKKLNELNTANKSNSNNKTDSLLLDAMNANVMIEENSITTDSDVELINTVERQQQIDPKLTMNLPTETKADQNKISQQKPEIKDKTKITTGTEQQNLINKDGTIKNLLGGESKSLDATANALNTIQQPIVLPQETQQVNYTQIFQHLGNFINSYTARDVATTTKGSAGDQAKASSFIENQNQIMKNAIIQEHASVDVQPPSLDELNKAAYNAKIKIYPPELGPVLANLKMDKNNIELIIQTQSAQVKEIVEANLPQLREQFQKADINLTNIQVQNSESQNANAQNGNDKNHSESFQANGQQLDLEQNQSISPKDVKKSNNKLVDTYA